MKLKKKIIRGENACPAFASNDSPCVDLFFKTVPDILLPELKSLLEKAWKEDPGVTLKLIFNLGNVRKDGGGKMDKV